jgi:hypothetical protein
MNCGCPAWPRTSFSGLGPSLTFMHRHQMRISRPVAAVSHPKFWGPPPLHERPPSRTISHFFPTTEEEGDSFILVYDWLLLSNVLKYLKSARANTQSVLSSGPCNAAGVCQLSLSPHRSRPQSISSSLPPLQLPKLCGPSPEPDVSAGISTPGCNLPTSSPAAPAGCPCLLHRPSRQRALPSRVIDHT